MDFLKIMQIINSLKEDGALEKEDAIIILSMIADLLETLLVSVKNRWVRVALYASLKATEKSIEVLSEEKEVA
jgi:uncharacterized membrane protein YbaN (DUF454 family)